MKYLGFVCRALPKLISSYPKVNHNCHHRDKMSFTKRYNDARTLIIKINKALRVKLITSGNINLPTIPSFLLTPNHQSFMDALIMIEVMKQQCSFVAKKETLKYPIVGKVLTSLDGLYLDREDLRQEMKIMQKVRQSLKEDNKKWIIFPEGTRTKDKDKKIGDFKPGTYKMAMNAKVNIYPVAIWGSFRVLDRKIKLKQYPIYLHILDPITPDIYKDKSTTEVSELVKSKIQEKVDELKALDEKELPKYQL